MNSLIKIWSLLSLFFFPQKVEIFAFIYLKKTLSRTHTGCFVGCHCEKNHQKQKNIAYIIINDHMAPLLIFFDVIQMLEQVLEVEDELNFDTM